MNSRSFVGFPSGSVTIFAPGLPLCEALIHHSLAVVVKPEKDRTYVPVGFSEGMISYKESAISSQDSNNADLLVSPIVGWPLRA